MKMTKILVGALAAVALVAGLTGCNWSLTSALQKSFGEDIFKYNDSTYDAGLGTWTVEQDNSEGTDVIRGVKLLLTKHSDISGVVTIKNQDKNSWDGVCGIAFDVNSTKDAEGNEIYNFIIAGVRNVKGTSQYYISYFGNVTEDDMSKSNFGAIKDNKFVQYSSVAEAEADITAGTLTGAYEVPLSTSDGSMKTLGIALSDGVLQVAIDTKEDSDGSYTVKFYDSSVYDADNHTVVWTKASPKATETISGTKINKTEAAQAKCGVYANVYAGADGEGHTGKLNATLEILELTHEAVDAE